MIKNITIFDLDGTCIDSSHRTPTKEDGTLDLANYKKMQTPENIFKDTLLPLAQEINKRSKAGDYTIICTARNMSEADYEFLMDEGLNADKIISRKDGDETPDDILKAKALKSLFNLKQFKNLNKVMFDDAPSVRSTLRKIGIKVMHPDCYNKRIA